MWGHWHLRVRQRCLRLFGFQWYVRLPADSNITDLLEAGFGY